MRAVFVCGRRSFLPFAVRVRLGQGCNSVSPSLLCVARSRKESGRATLRPAHSSHVLSLPISLMLQRDSLAINSALQAQRVELLNSPVETPNSKSVSPHTNRTLSCLQNEESQQASVFSKCLAHVPPRSSLRLWCCSVDRPLTCTIVGVPSSCLVFAAHSSTARESFLWQALQIQRALCTSLRRSLGLSSVCSVVRTHEHTPRASRPLARTQRMDVCPPRLETPPTSFAPSHRTIMTIFVETSVALGNL